MFSVITPWALGWIVGTALQLQQEQLWPGEWYGGLGAAALAMAWAVVRFKRALAVAWMQAGVWLVLAGVLAFSKAGARASHFAQSAMNPALEGHT